MSKRSDLRAMRALSVSRSAQPPGGPPLVSLRTSSDILQLLERAAAMIIADSSIQPVEAARTLTYIAATAAVVVKSHEIESRLAAIEQRFAA